MRPQLHYITQHYTTLITLHYATTTTATTVATTTKLHYTILQLQLHYLTLHYTTLYQTTVHYTTLHHTTLHYTTLYCTTPHYIQQLWWGDHCNHCSHSKTQLQPPFGPSVNSLCHPWFTTTNLSYRFPIFETSATALRGTTGKINPDKFI